MLTKLEKRFLRACRDLGGSGVPSSDLQELAQASSEYELYLCASHLKKNGYLSEVIVYLAGDFSVTLSYDGEHFDEVYRIELKQFLSRSVLVPIVVSALTTAIIEGIKWLL